jgi:ribokinase
MSTHIAVIGSINMDLVVKAERVPTVGETLHGQSFKLIPGGKGANQAVAIAKLGGKAFMIGCVGEDEFGSSLVGHLTGQEINVRMIRTIPQQSTGTATIIVDGTGDNRIIVVPGANGEMSTSDVDMAVDAITTARAVVLQFEIPLDVVEHSAALAKKNSIPVILNPAPAYPVSSTLLSHVDYLILNETEAMALTGLMVAGVDGALEAARCLRDSGVGCVVITLGEKGALAVSSSQQFHVPAMKVDVIDTTAAGDTFVGAFAVACVEGKSLEDAVRLAVNAGTLAITRFGAQPSIPTREDLQAFMSETKSFH